MAKKKKVVVALAVIWLVAMLPAVQAALLCNDPLSVWDAFRDKFIKKLGSEPSDSDYNLLFTEFSGSLKSEFEEKVSGIDYDPILERVNALTQNLRIRFAAMLYLTSAISLLKDADVFGDSDVLLKESPTNTLFKNLKKGQPLLEQLHKNGDDLFLPLLSTLTPEKKEAFLNKFAPFARPESTLITNLLSDPNPDIRTLAREKRASITPRWNKLLVWVDEWHMAHDSLFLMLQSNEASLGVTWNMVFEGNHQQYAWYMESISPTVFLFLENVFASLTKHFTLSRSAEHSPSTWAMPISLSGIAPITQRGCLPTTMLPSLSLMTCPYKTVPFSECLIMALRFWSLPSLQNFAFL